MPGPAEPLDTTLYPPPPDSFDPALVGFVGTRTGIIGYGDPAWVGAIDGSSMACGSPAHGRVSLGVGRGVLYQEDTDPGPIPDLLLREASGTVRPLAARVENLFVGPRFVWVGRRGGTVEEPGADLGVWRVRLSDGKSRRVLPPMGRRTNDWIVGSADGRSVAVAMYFAPGIAGAGRIPRVRVRFDGGAVTRIPYLVPAGFDARGRLVGMREGGLAAYDPRHGRFIDLGLGEKGGFTTPSGGWVIAYAVEIPRSGGRSIIRGVRVEDGARRAWRLPRGEWQISPELTTDRYLVFWDVDDNTKIGLIDLDEGWVGYLRFEAQPAQADALAAGCEAMADAAIAALGMDDEPALSGDVGGRDGTPIERTGAQRQISEDEARAAGLGIDSGALPAGLAIAYMDTHEPVHAVRYFLTSDGWSGDETYHDVLAGGGAVLVVSDHGAGSDVVANELAFARKVGTEDRLGIVKVGVEDAILAHGDLIGGIRSWNVAWSDHGRTMELETAFATGAEAVNLARAIACSSS